MDDSKDGNSSDIVAPRPAAEGIAVADLASDLHQIYDSVVAKTLPIYFGPLLGELFLADR